MRQRDELDELADMMLDFVPSRSKLSAEQVKLLHELLDADETHVVVTSLSARTQRLDLLLPDEIMKLFATVAEEFVLEEEFEELREHQEALKKRQTAA